MVVRNQNVFWLDIPEKKVCLRGQKVDRGRMSSADLPVEDPRSVHVIQRS